ncbi:MAG: hypothetical protein ABR505_10250 [Actinomycetota bacterium]
MGRLLRSKRVLYVAPVVVGLGLLPPVQARAKAIVVLAEALGLKLPRPFAPAIARQEIQLDGVTGDLYSHPGQAPPLLLLPGAAPRGKEDPRVIRVATALARSDRTVFVPVLELAEKRFVEEDIDRIVRATEALVAHPSSTGGAVVLGFSYGGSYALIAAADPRLKDTLESVAVFGAYYDLVGYVQAVTTGESVIDGERVGWDGDPRAIEVARDVGVRLSPPQSRKKLRAAFDGRVSPQELSPGARATYELFTNTDPDKTYALAEELPSRLKAKLAAFSPASVSDRITVPVIAIHSTDDPVVPHGEALRLKQALPRTRLLLVELFRHVNLSAGSPREWLTALDDFFSLWRFTSWALSNQE